MRLELTICNSTAYPVGGCCAIGCISDFPSDNYYAFTDKEVAKWEKEIAEFEQKIVKAGKSIAFASLNMSQEKSAEMLERLGYICPIDGWAIRDPYIKPSSGGVRVYVKAVFGTTPK